MDQILKSFDAKSGLGKTASGGRLNLQAPYRAKARRRHDSADGGRHIAH